LASKNKPNAVLIFGVGNIDIEVLSIPAKLVLWPPFFMCLQQHINKRLAFKGGGSNRPKESFIKLNNKPNRDYNTALHK